MAQTLSDFFKTLDAHFEALGPEEGSSIKIRVRGKLIELRFLLAEHARCVSSYLLPAPEDTDEEPDAVFHYWTEHCSAFVPKGHEGETAVWQSRDETGYFRVIPELEMFGVDKARDRYYHCRTPIDYDDYTIHGHSMASTFTRWAINNGHLLLHSACVGAEGKGLMISARGGGGKSTLAITALLTGLDFVSDDYILVNQQGPMRAFPLYRVVGLNPDMAAILKPDMPVLRTEPRRGDKLYLDASAYDIKPSLPVNGILFPNPCKAKEPLIRRSPAGPVLAKVIDSTARQMRVFRDPEPYRVMASRLSGLPVYEFLLTEDLYINCEYLKEFMKKEL
ncbi:MAG: hypothetical protein IJM17_01370 [Firmicutes bacterium]|nr:hypothetical protein [Bacillota bacterium]